jgi:hypothetical protein
LAFTATALQLVNRVHRLRRMPDVGSFSETEDLATLDVLNTSIEEVLSSRRWEFDMRRDQIVLRGRLTGLTFTNSPSVLSSFVGVRSAGLDQEDMNGSYITRMLITGSEDYPQTAIRLIYSSAVLGGVQASFVAGAALSETISSAAGELFYAEYILPDTVRDILRVTYQEDALNLVQIDPIVEFDELYPRPSIQYGPPEVVSVGGFDIATYQGVDNEEPPGLRMIVWPIPDQAYVLDYSYHYRHPELASVDDTLDGVPPDVISQIVETAAVKMKNFYEKDYDALRLGVMTQNKIAQIHARQGGMFADRKPAGNWDGSAGRESGGSSLIRGRTVGS